MFKRLDRMKIENGTIGSMGKIWETVSCWELSYDGVREHGNI